MDDRNTPLYEDLSDIPSFDDDPHSAPVYRESTDYYNNNSGGSIRQPSRRRQTQSGRSTAKRGRRKSSVPKLPFNLKITAPIKGKASPSRASATSSRVYPDGYTGRRRPSSARTAADRAARIRKQRTTLVVFGLLVIAALILIIVGVSSVIKSSSKSSSSSAETAQSATTQTAAETTITVTPVPAATPAPEKDITGLEITDYDSMITVGDSAYEFYKFDSEAASTAITALNEGDLKVNVPMYAMLIPTSIDITLPLSLLDTYADKTSDQQKAESYFLSQLEDSITPVYCYDLLKAHCNENLFFSSDNHINGLTAYYVYTAWCEEKGVTPISLDKCTKKEYSDFYGNISYSTGVFLDADTVEVYEVPMSLSYTYTDDNGSTQSGSVYPDVSGYSSMSKYQAFCGGSHSYSVITNNERSEGSTCLLIIDSNGFALAPFIACHYAKTYVVDYRWYEENAMELANDEEVSDIVVACSMSVTAYTSLADSLNSVMNG